MKYTRCGDIDIPVMSMGCWGIGGGFMWGDQDKGVAIKTIHAALDAGVTLFDTAEGYNDGVSESTLGEALSGRRSEALIATKVSPSHFGPGEIIAACESSLARLQTDYIDLYQLHWPSDAPVEQIDEQITALLESGKIRNFGVCNFGVKNLNELLKKRTCVTNQLAYSLVWRAIEYEVLPLCRDNGIGVLTYSTLLHGLLSGRYRSADEVPVDRARTRHFSGEREKARHGEEGCEKLLFSTLDEIRKIAGDEYSMKDLALLWATAKPGVTSVIFGARTPEHVAENVALAESTLPQELIAALDEATEALKKYFGTNIDMWQSPGRSA